MMITMKTFKRVTMMMMMMILIMMIIMMMMMMMMILISKPFVKHSRRIISNFIRPVWPSNQ